MSGLAIIAGADQELATALRRKLVDRGMRVAGLGDITAPGGDDGHWANWVETNFCDPEACSEAMAELEQKQGAPDALVYARTLRDASPLHEMHRDQWAMVVERTLDGAFNVCRTIVPGMRARRQGRIVLISSLAARSGQANHANHCAASAGLLGLGKALARENAALGITVNMIASSSLKTDLDDADGGPPPVGRSASATDVAGCVSFLISPEAELITGACLDLNGGAYMAV